MPDEKELEAPRALRTTPSLADRYLDHPYLFDEESFAAQWAKSMEKSNREKKWYDDNFGIKVVISDKVPVDTIYAVNWQGIIDDMQRGASYAEAVGKNSATITGLLA